jgi:hypothetical protein
MVCGPASERVGIPRRTLSHDRVEKPLTILFARPRGFCIAVDCNPAVT